MSLITSLLSSLWPYIAAGLAGLAVLWRVYAAGQNKQIAKEQKAKLEAVTDKKAKDDEINRLSPADLDKRFDRWVRDK